MYQAGFSYSEIVKCSLETTAETIMARYMDVPFKNLMYYTLVSVFQLLVQILPREATVLLQSQCVPKVFKVYCADLLHCVP